MRAVYRWCLIVLIFVGTHMGVLGGMMRDWAVRRLKKLEERR